MNPKWFNAYCETAHLFCQPHCFNWRYLITGLRGEVGEIFDCLKKQLRGDYDRREEEFRQDLIHECGDAVWYVVEIMRLYNRHEFEGHETIQKIFWEDPLPEGAELGSWERRRTESCIYKFPADAISLDSRETVVICRSLIPHIERLCMHHTGTPFEGICLSNIAKLRRRYGDQEVFHELRSGLFNRKTKKILLSSTKGFEEVVRAAAECNAEDETPC